MKRIIGSNLIILFLFLIYLILIGPNGESSALLIETEGLPKPGEMALNSEKDIPRHIFIAGNYLKSGRFKEVIAICNQVLNWKENHIEAHAYMAAAYKGLGENEKYQKEVEIAKKLAPRSPALYQALAATYHSLKELKSAEDSYKKGIKKASETTELRMGLASLYLEEGRLKEAAGQYREVLKRKGLAHKHFLNANFALCRIGLRNKAYEEVIKRARMVTELYPPIPQGYQLLGAAYLAKGKSDQAIKVYEKLMKINSKSPVPFQELTLIYNDKLRDYEKAIRYAKEAVQKFSKDAKSQDVLGWVYYKREKYPEALKQFRSASQLAKRNPRYLYHLGLTHQKLGDKAKAKEAFEGALGLIAPKKSKDFTEELKTRIDQCK